MTYLVEDPRVGGSIPSLGTEETLWIPGGFVVLGGAP